MAADSVPDYCPFCGARLRDGPDALDEHFERHADCRERFAGWSGRPRGGAGDGDARKPRLMRTVLMWVVIAVVMAYSLLIAQQLLLGVLAAGIVYVAFQYTADSDAAA